MLLAFIKFAGLASGGGERYLQSYAIILKEAGHEVDYYYTDTTPNTRWHPNNDLRRKQLIESHGVNTIKVNLEEYNREQWVNTNFWDKYKGGYDFVHSVIGGASEFPFNQISDKIIHTVHGINQHDQSNIYKNILLCKWQADLWIKNGGNSQKIEIIPSIVQVPSKTQENFRKELGIPEDAFVYGYHQRDDPAIFTSTPLDCFGRLAENDRNAYFIMMGGSHHHREFASRIGMTNTFFLPHSSDTSLIHKFLQTLDCYTHSKSYGEVCSACLIEAMYHGLPIVSHPGQDMGHTEMLEGIGKICCSKEQYLEEMIFLKENKNFHTEINHLTQQKYDEVYSFNVVAKKIREIYEVLL